MDTKIIYDGLIAKGNEALDSLDKIAPDAVNYSFNLLNNILAENKDTVFGRKFGFADIKNYDEYRKKLPLTTYADYKELVDRIYENGEQNVLTNKPIVHFCITTGTTSAPKLIPLIEEAKNLDTVYTMPAAFAMVDRTLKSCGKIGFPNEKGLFLIEVGKLSRTESGFSIGGISSTSVRESDGLLSAIAVSPREVITPDAYLDSKYLHLLFALRERNLGWIGSCYMTTVAGIMECMVSRWKDLCDDIENGSVNPEVEMSDETRKSINGKLTPDKQRADELRKIFTEGFDEPILPKIWKKLSFIGAIGSGGFSIHTEKVRRFAGDGILFCNLVIEASESILAVADGCNTDEFILLPQAAFFEFLPENSENELEICTIKDVEVGSRYEIVVTTLSGLYRYRMKDIVEVTGFYGQIPKVRFSHRSNVYIDIAGEKTMESDMIRAIDAFNERTGLRVSEYCAYAEMSPAPGHYVFLTECDGKADKSKLSEYEAILDEACCLTFGYKYERLAGNIDPCKLLFQQKQTHILYRELKIMKGASPNQLKPVRVLDTDEKKAFFMKMTEEV